VTTRRYAEAGVDLHAAEQAKERIAQLVASTRTALSFGPVGAFGGMIRLPPDLRRPLLVLSTDGVGTKVLIARAMQRLDTVGEDLVNHSVNDILVHGALPIAFLDYVAGAGLSAEEMAQIVEGVARGCRRHDMALVGGETAQMPGLYQPGQFDLAGTIVGVVEEDHALHGDRIVPGDVVLGYASTGLHTNGYTLARAVLFETLGYTVESVVPELGDAPAPTLGDVLLAVHRSYAPAIRPVLDCIHGLAHVTGGGMGGNLVRVLPPDCEAVIRAGSWEEPPLFGLLRRGGIAEAEMREVFNLGIGMVAVLAEEDLSRARAAAETAGVATWVIGEIRQGARRVRFVER
jgi:phosphoribosylformylglycinamidine cyclo-ligase